MLCIVLMSCAASEEPAGPPPTPGAEPSTSTDTGAPAPGGANGAGAVAFDCLGDSGCPELRVEGDPPATLPSGAASPLRGYSDPSIRRDPDSRVLWMAYSWPSVHVDTDDSRTTRVETHLARSDDDGLTWQAAGPLWPSEPAVDPVSGAHGWTDHEVPNLLPIPDGESAHRWIGARLDLFVPRGEGLARRPPSSFRITVLTATSPGALATGSRVVLGSAATDERWGVDVDLATLDDDLGRCSVWNEPALHHSEGTLYLALRCLVLDGTGTPDVAASTLEVFATEPIDEPSSWRWRHQGRLAGHDEAVELGGDGLTQVDFATAIDGTTLAVLTPDTWSASDREFVHHGLAVVEVASLEDPQLARRNDGQLAVRAVVTASDLDPLGPGAGTYEPTAATGLVLMRRQIGEASLVASIHDTGLHP